MCLLPSEYSSTWGKQGTNQQIKRSISRNTTFVQSLKLIQSLFKYIWTRIEKGNWRDIGFLLKYFMISFLHFSKQQLLPLSLLTHEKPSVETITDFLVYVSWSLLSNVKICKTLACAHTHNQEGRLSIYGSFMIALSER